MSDLSFFSLLFAFAATCVGAFFLNRSHDKRKYDHDAQLGLLRKARTLYSYAPSDVVKLDSLYEATYRSAVLAEKDQKFRKSEALMLECRLIHELKNKVIKESVTFERKIVTGFVRRTPASHLQPKGI